MHDDDATAASRHDVERYRTAAIDLVEWIEASAEGEDPHLIERAKLNPVLLALGAMVGATLAALTTAMVATMA